MSELTSVGGNATSLSGIVQPLLAKRFPPPLRGNDPADQRRRENGSARQRQRTSVVVRAASSLAHAGRAAKRR